MSQNEFNGRIEQIETMFDACYHQKESSVYVHQEGRGFKVDAQIQSWWVMESGTTIDLWLSSLFVKVAHFV